MTKTSKTSFGKTGEEFAEKLLLQRGYKILQKNFRSYIGEIDIIAKDGDTLVFVEVKTRTGKKFGLPEEAVTSRKIEKIKKTAQFYMLKNPNYFKKQRIDVVSLIIRSGKVDDYKIIKVSS